MPLYEYECFVCSHRFERIQKTTASPVTECPSCGGAVRRLLGAPALQFKGSGWYVTDYGKGNGGRAGETSSTSEKTEKAASSETKKPAAASSSTTGSKASGSAS